MTALVVALVLGALALLVTAAPLLRPEEEEAPVPEERHSQAPLEARREMLFDGIRDLDFEHSMGKLEEADYRDIRQSLVSESAQVLEQIDVAGSDHVLDQWIEAEVLRRRRRPEAPTSGWVSRLVAVLDGGSRPAAAAATAALLHCPACGGANRAEALFCDRCGATQAAPACPACGMAQRPGAVYCARCGDKLAGMPAEKA